MRQILSVIVSHLRRTRHREPLLGGVAIHRAGGMDRFVASAPRDDETGQLDAIML
jgi:hypothetical protein